MKLFSLNRKILQEHELKLEVDFKFTEAAKVRDKINQQKILEQEKAKQELKRIHDEEVKMVEKEKSADLKMFNEQYDSLYNELIRRFEDLNENLSSDHKNELETAIKEFNETFPENNPKSSPEILDLYRRLEGIVKKKE